MDAQGGRVASISVDLRGHYGCSAACGKPPMVSCPQGVQLTKFAPREGVLRFRISESELARLDKKQPYVVDVVVFFPAM
ncbi:hypothetical protein CMI37_15725 [Candidatus Pacearchaeota archaeon]|nr:hypothetical protein [Candidatus Pacearchaeota archaeon]